MKKLISILGSTGSVGLTTLNIIDKDNKNFIPYLFSANKNYNLICKQIKKYKPKYFIINNVNIFLKVKKKFYKTRTKILNNFSSISLKRKSDITICAIPGIAGLKPTISLINFSKKILIANKESIICGWSLIKQKSIKSKTNIIPIDSEHFSIFNLIKNREKNEINKIYLTASGGPFLNYTQSELKKVKPKDALKHPKWKMGKKISIDSSTLMNKILELIEAQKIFDLSNDKLEILIHPNSLVHAIVDFKNGLKEFIYHETSMEIPIANAIYDGKLDIRKFGKFYNTDQIKSLFFKKVDKKKFPVIKLKNRIDEYPSTSIIINAANEIFVDQFLNKKVPFLSVNKIIMAILNDRKYKKYAIQIPRNISHIIKIDSWARLKTMEIIKKKYA